MTTIMSYGEWIDVCSRGTSGDQVSDILESWKVDAYKLLDINMELEQRINVLKDQLLVATQGMCKWCRHMDVLKYQEPCASCIYNDDYFRPGFLLENWQPQEEE